MSLCTFLCTTSSRFAYLHIYSFIIDGADSTSAFVSSHGMLLPAPIVSTGGAFTSVTFPPSHLARRHRLRRRPLQTAFADDYGLTDDGDFAIFGVNAEEAPPRPDDGDAPAPSAGTAIGWQGVGHRLFDEALLRSGRGDLGVGATNTHRDVRGNHLVPKSDPVVSEWLAAQLPSLQDAERATYAEGLTGLGFRPQCASARELKDEDLDFMKPLHRRFLYKEITGEEHTEP